MPDFVITDPNDNELTFGSFEEVPPGSSYSAVTGGPLELRLKNISGVARPNRELSVVERPPYVIASYVRLSADGVTFTQGPLQLGSFEAGEAKPFYLDVEVPENAPGGPNQRCTLKVRAYNGG